MSTTPEQDKHYARQGTREQHRIKEMLASLDACLLRDRPVLERRLAGLRRRLADGRPVDRGLAELSKAIEQSMGMVEQRRRSVPAVTYPEELPVSAERERIKAALLKHQVVVVCGDTGSGKSTQLPKLCLEMGYGIHGAVAHTQPRRLAARSVAARIAQELGVALGSGVGYRVRFGDRVGPSTHIKLMTDGILLAETRSDPALSAYQAIIVDEAHERSLNIDFLLGYLKRLLPRRPDLKLIITSATIDPERFSRHFQDAPIVNVEGRTFPVEVRYRPLAGDEDDRDRDRERAILEAIDELAAEGRGDILVFLPGEREIRETAESLRKHRPGDSEVLPLYARLSNAEQERVFRTGGRRRIVLATNVAETSITVPGIRYVVDSGVARISRYSYRSKVQRLPIEPISRASAEQRKGRCGRVAPGICIRLFSEEDFTGRPLYTAPEIQRTNLAAVILQMASLRLGAVDAFPFVDPPDPRFVRDGYRLLMELGAVDARQCLTALGKDLARLPVDPRLGRMVLAARAQGCLREVLVIASALSIQDPRERPLDARDKADRAHAAFLEPSSDFLSYLKLWDLYHEQVRHLTNRKLRAYCRASFLSFVRMREWHDIHQQLLGMLHDMGVRQNTDAAEPEVIHQAVLTGLLGYIGRRSQADKTYLGARNTHFHLHPGSALAGRLPKWVMAAELVETSRLFARIVAPIDPRWVEGQAAHLVKRLYGEPHWERRRSQVVAVETVSLYGLPLVSGRKVDFGRIDPVAAREIFIRRALVEGDYRTRAAFLEHNRSLLLDLGSLEHKARRRDLLVDDEALFAFYEERLPAEIVNGAALDRWLRRTSSRALWLTPEAVMARAPDEITVERYPDRLEVAGQRLELRYRFAPGDPADGVTLRVPLPILNQLEPRQFEWLVPGLLEEKLVQLIKSLPKSLRRNFVPAPDFAQAAATALGDAGESSLLGAFTAQLRRMTGVDVPAGAWRWDFVPAHLLMRFEVLDEEGRVLAVDRDLSVLQRDWGARSSRSFGAGRETGLNRDKIMTWDFGPLPESTVFERGGLELTGYPALDEVGAQVALKLFERPDEAHRAHRRGLRGLFALRFREQLKRFERRLPDGERLCLLYATTLARPKEDDRTPASEGCTELRREVVLAAVDRVFLSQGADIRDAPAFERRAAVGQGRILPGVERVCRLLEEILGAYREVQARMGSMASGARSEGVDDVRRQLAGLVYRGFLVDVPGEWLEQYPRYLKAILIRLRRLDEQPLRDARLASRYAPLWQAWQRLREDLARLPAERVDEVQTLRWLLEELRVSLFAQELKTRGPVSMKRIEQRIEALKAP